MLTKTTEIGVNLLLYLGLRSNGEPVSPRRIAEDMGVSSTYLAKTCSLLVKANILRSHKGTRGGVTLAHPPAEITLLSVLEACQGQIIGDYCQDLDNEQGICSFHQAMLELHHAIVSVLSRWTLDDLMKQPRPYMALEGHVDCRVACSNPVERSAV